MKGKSIVIAGGAGTGKTFLMKSLIKEIPPERVLLYDINNEHPDYSKRYPVLPSIDDFIFQAHESRNVIVVCEDATIFFTSHNRSDEMLDLLARRRHTGNGIIMLFHSLRQIPDYMISFINTLIILKTSGDTEEKIDKKFDNDAILQAFKRIQAADWKNNNGIRFSPYEIVTNLV